MAQIVGHHRGSSQKIPVTHVFLIIVVAVSLIGFMLVSDEKWQDHILSLAGAVAVILAIVGFALNKVNPMGWKQLFQKAEYERHLQGDRRIVDALKMLGEEYTILCGFTFELLFVEFLILGPGGIFVIGKTTSSETIRVEDEVLMAGNESLAKRTGNLWRISHLVNLVIKKGYDLEIVPKPILVATHANTIEQDQYDGISIVEADELAAVVKRLSTENLRPELVQGFTTYLYQRYFK